MNESLPPRGVLVDPGPRLMRPSRSLQWPSGLRQSEKSAPYLRFLRRPESDRLAIIYCRPRSYSDHPRPRWQTGATYQTCSQRWTELPEHGGRRRLVASRRLVNEVVDVFLEDAPVMLTRLRDAARAHNSEELAGAAHAIKGSAGLFSQGPAYESAKRLEHLAKAGDLTKADAACADVEADVSQLMAELRNLRARS